MALATTDRVPAEEADLDWRAGGSDFEERVTITHSRGWHAVRLRVGRGDSVVINFGRTPQDEAFASNVRRQIEDGGYESVVAGGEIRFRRGNRPGGRTWTAALSPA